MTTTSDRRRAALVAVLLAGSAVGAHADGLADLRAALARLPGQAPLKASVQARDWRRTGDGKEAKERQGQATIALEDGPRGLQPLYGRDLLGRLDVESRALVKDKSAPTPLTQALAQLGVGELRTLSSAAPVLQRELDDAEFKSETTEPWNGRPARKLVLESGLDRVSEDNRKYLKAYRMTLSVWIGADGTPLASQRRVDLSGRAFVVVSFEQHADLQRVYAVAGDRLLATSEEEKGSAKGAGESQDFRTERSLQVAP